MTSSDHALEAAQPVVAATPSPSYISPLLRSLNQSSTRQPSRTARSFAQALNTRELAQSSGYSSSSLNDSNYSSLTHNQYTPADMSSSRSLSQSEKATFVQSLRTHRVNTLIELRRIEKAFATHKSADVTEPMTSAWAHYVNSNNLLSELRGLTKSYPFSSECLDEAKWMVIADPQSVRSWNYCWLVLQNVKNQKLIAKHARQLAAKPLMWGGRTPTASGVEQLSAACVAEWTRALNQLLRHWESPPTTMGR